MNIFQSPETKAFINKVLVYILVIYTCFILGRSVLINFQLKRQIDLTKKEIANLEQQNQNISNLMLYYQSDSFKEVEARSKLGLKKPGETVVYVPTKKYENYQQELAAERAKMISNDKTELPNWENWWKYFTQ
jgi:cell division protein FtsB